MTATRTEQKDKLVADVKLAMADVDELLQSTATDANGAMTELQARMRERLQAAKKSLIDAEQEVVAKAKAAAHTTDAYVRANPWTAVGVAAAIGVLAGVLLRRR
jgi:ElaB/YqjD/DUF883 family membrane-anchored ribosome-binding protein